MFSASIVVVIVAQLTPQIVASIYPVQFLELIIMRNIGKVIKQTWENIKIFSNNKIYIFLIAQTQGILRVKHFLCLNIN